MRYFKLDMERFDKAFREADAIRTEPDGFTWIDESKVPADLMRAYRTLISYGAANGLV